MGRWKNVLFSLACGLALLGLPREAPAGPPTDQLKTHVEQIIRVLQDPKLQGESKAAERRAAIRKVADELFDFEGSARRALAQHWQARTPAERKEFVALYADLLERSYISKIESYSGEPIRYLGESSDGDQTTVRTQIVSKKGTEIPIDYRLRREGDRWLIYDVVIEGVSMVASYRAQFNRIIQTSSYAELINRLKAKEAPAG